MFKARRLYLDNAKAVLIYLMVLMHFVSMGIIQRSALFQESYEFVYAFHMHAFIFISGFLSQKSDTDPVTCVKKYLIPYFLICVLTWIYQKLLFGTGTFMVWIPPNTLWFLLALFLYKLFTPVFQRLKFVVIISFAIGISAGFFTIFDSDILALGNFFGYLPFYVAGLKFPEERLTKLRQIRIVRTGIAVAGVCLILGLIYLPKAFDLGGNIFRLRWSYELMGLSADIGILIRLYSYAAAFCATLGLMLIMPDRKLPITDIGKNTITVYVGHMFLLKVFQKIKFVPGMTGNLGWDAALTILIALVIVVILALEPVAKGYHKGLVFVNSAIFKQYGEYREQRKPS